MIILSNGEFRTLCRFAFRQHSSRCGGGLYKVIRTLRQTFGKLGVFALISVLKRFSYLGLVVTHRGDNTLLVGFKAARNEHVRSAVIANAIQTERCTLECLSIGRIHRTVIRHVLGQLQVTAQDRIDHLHGNGAHTVLCRGDNAVLGGCRAIGVQMERHIRRLRIALGNRTRLAHQVIAGFQACDVAVGFDAAVGGIRGALWPHLGRDSLPVGAVGPDGIGCRAIGGKHRQLDVAQRHRVASEIARLC